MQYNNIFIEATQDTPKIDFQFDNGVFIFEGKSYSENTFEFYKPLLKELEEYLDAYDFTNIDNLVFSFKLTYFNSSSSKALFDIFDLIDNFRYLHKEIKVTINWLYDFDDDSSKEDGEDFQDSFESLNITLVEL